MHRLLAQLFQLSCFIYFWKVWNSCLATKVYPVWIFAFQAHEALSVGEVPIGCVFVRDNGEVTTFLHLKRTNTLEIPFFFKEGCLSVALDLSNHETDMLSLNSYREGLLLFFFFFGGGFLQNSSPSFNRPQRPLEAKHLV